ncbi:MAG TPA: response regulator transcription factor [Dyella sp.]|uniref:response regulator transcription factor n=1 Tax=Dyella sp. TaxID=1869338 RepID=UPI002F921089
MNEFTLRIALADDHPAIRIGLKTELLRHPSFTLIGEACDGEGLLRLLEDAPADVAVVDYSMPGGDGDSLGLFLQLRRQYPALRIVALTAVKNLGMVRSLLAGGVECILSKADDIGHLAAGIHAAHANGRYFSPTMAAMVDMVEVRRTSSSAGALSARETEVVQLYAAGLTVGEIAQRLGRSKQTISAQKTNAMRKLGLERSVDLIHYQFELQQA